MANLDGSSLPPAPATAGGVSAAIPTHHQLDAAALARVMARHIPSFAAERLPTIGKFSSGQSNPTYLVEDAAGTRYVLRKKPPGKLLASAHAVDREFRILSALQHSNVPVPRVYFLCEDTAVLGTAFYVMEYLSGRVFVDPALPELDAAERTSIYLEFVRVLAELHAIPHADVGLKDFGPSAGYGNRQLRRWGSQYQRMVAERPAERCPEMDQLLEWLTKVAPRAASHDRTTLVHGDYSLSNVMFHPTEPRIIGVLDWELATTGHPLSDLAYVCMPWHRRMQGTFGTPGIPAPAQLCTLYAQTNRQLSPPFPFWDFYLLLSFFRLAAIAFGVYVRSLEGNASSPQARTFGVLARTLAADGAVLCRTARL
eukprot:NODE_548_length_1303_cov_295.119617_g396_i0.p1 GENE.NODE_548_length_1303_cov_295.119617_g396_i0~~NODE_548_length_1303_cov_295.119617_g396_i0.p1  ORF type:complete len:369 (+),score=105.23 NODE_548_length_1303_cov_295.119617_g396_i0:135-1241(+)